MLGRFTNRPYNDNGNSTSGEHRGKSGQPRGVAPTLRLLSDYEAVEKQTVVIGLHRVKHEFGSRTRSNKFGRAILFCEFGLFQQSHCPYISCKKILVFREKFC